ncbi:YajQ family cyclic di-GMP-binding protein [Niveispirillum lacus]|uniref:Nucleotide-binding protein CHU95_14820 n=1 Tax=Niveispirillum lacus TaxID=1981099 RepID=A0A255YWT8_9PROT|nr:YajQ family cyclic di-GMP-binding protein [Niveispirillum lacus]OYQ33641.1 YajQ family cyclic di-GMP-binding protein [Niveispirillum lacus]
MPSFDIVSKTEIAEVNNAVQGVVRELQTRFDFKGSKSTLEVKEKESEIHIHTEDSTKLAQLQEMLKGYFVRRKLDPGCLDWGKEENAAGGTLRQTIKVKQGIDQTLAKQITKAIKDSKMKVQASIQGDELRVTGKKIDDLQAAIAMVKGLKIEQPLQYVNFRD